MTSPLRRRKTGGVLRFFPPSHREESGMTYAVVARCPTTGQFGIAVASYSIAIGRHCDGALCANTGAGLTLGSPSLRNNHLAMNLLAQGHTAAQALDVATKKTCCCLSHALRSGVISSYSFPMKTPCYQKPRERTTSG
jgi:hypothetical protein